jgi:5-methylcytosine-specific restriction endonuclease McrA
MKLCKFVGCHRLIDDGEYCNYHNAPICRPRTMYEGAARYNEPLYKTTKWKKLSARLRANAVCCLCGNPDTLEVHHVIRPLGNEDLFYDEDNLVVVCTSCHSKLTNGERAISRKK